MNLVFIRVEWTKKLALFWACFVSSSLYDLTETAFVFEKMKLKSRGSISITVEFDMKIYWWQFLDAFEKDWLRLDEGKSL